MLFNSYIFIFCLLPLTLIVYFLLNYLKKYKFAKIALIISSLVFYGYYNVRYLPIIILSIIINYIINTILYKYEKNRKIIFIIGLILNIGVLFYFKYFNFFIDNVNRLFNVDFVTKTIMLPLGISFFTFQQISYVIDSYKKEVPHYNFIDYALYVSFFPQLIAGPIVLHSEVVPQFEDEKKKKFNYNNFSKGLMAFAFGLAKKVLIADTFSQVVTYGYSNVYFLNTTTAIFTMLAYTFQIYFDFSGYCDMAAGIGLMFNIELPMNFNSPYKSISIIEFWDRWHMSLTRFFTKYLYIPLGGNRKGKKRAYINTMIVFLISGLWHGAGWTFVLWGMLHGFSLCLNKIFKKHMEKLNSIWNWIMTFIFVNITWIFFRADSISQALLFIKNMILSMNFNLNDIFYSIKLPELNMLKVILPENYMVYVQFIFFISLFVFALFAVLNMSNTNERIKNFKPTFKYSIITAVLIVWCIVSLSGISEFIYFGF